jgi:hypothetical protein
MRKSTFIGLIPGFVLLACLQSSASPMPPTGFLSETPIRSSDRNFGGISAIDLSDDGLRILAISDNGSFGKGVIARDKSGQIIGVTFESLQKLKTFEGSKYTEQKDTEGIAVAKDGTVFISYELYTYVAAFPKIDGYPNAIPSPPEFKSYENNRSLEALAIGPDETLYAIPELPAKSKTDFPVFRLRAGQWDSDLSIPMSGGYLAVSADIGPDGRFYLLERLYYGLPAFSSRLRRFDMTPDGFVNQEILIKTPLGTHQNLEGLSVWRNRDGTLVATMVADDNFNFLFSSQIVEYALPD